MIDIIIPAYNARDTIVRTLHSIAMQENVSRLKVTIVDDCSDCGYEDIAEAFAPFLPVEVIRAEANGGPAVARQIGIDETDGDFITFIDADDTLYSSRALSVLEREIIASDLDMVGGHFLEECEGGAVVPHRDNFVWMFGKLYRRSFLDRFLIRFVKVPSSYLPTGVYWLITHKSAVMAPAKLQDYKIHSDPPGINGDLVEGRVIHDAFVIGAKAKAVYAAVNAAAICNTPTITEDATNDIVNIASSAGASIYFTVDGTDPRYSETVKAYSANVNYASAGYGTNTTIKAYAVSGTNKPFASAVASAVVNA